jgi:hypothetical protein
MSASKTARTQSVERFEWSEWYERHGRKSREAAVREMGIDRIQSLKRIERRQFDSAWLLAGVDDVATDLFVALQL